MKKAIVAVLVVAAAAVAGVLLLKRPGLTSLDCARLVPSNTLLFANFPDLHATALRWHETALYKIAHEPEVQAFLEKPKSKVPKSDRWTGTVERIKQIDPIQAFVAVVSVTNNMPHAVAGFRYKGNRKALEAAVADARKQAQEASPAGKDELMQYKGLEIESYSDKGVTVAGVFARDWYFAGNDVQLLKSTIDRFLADPPDGTLAKADYYKKGTEKLPPNPEALLFLQPSFVIDKLLAIAAATGQQVDPKQVAELRKVQAFAAATRFEHDRIRDSIFVLQPGAEKPPQLTRATLALTAPETLLYFAFAPVLPNKLDLPDTTTDTTGVLSGAKALADTLSKHGLTMADFKAAFGPEFSIQSDWPATTLQPTLNLAAEVKDKARAEKVIVALASDWRRDESGDVTLWTAPANEAAKITPAIGLSSKFAVSGLAAAGVKEALNRAKSNPNTLEKSPAFLGAISTVAKPDINLGYLDTKALFERVYGVLRPAVMLWGNFLPQLSQYVDVNKLPTTEAISKHLFPIVFSASQQDDGTLVESTGPVTAYEAMAVVGAAGAELATRVLQGKLNIPGMAPISPGGSGLGFPTQPPAPPFAPRTPAPAPAPSSSGVPQPQPSPIQGQ